MSKKSKQNPEAGTQGVAMGRRRISYIDDKTIHDRLSEMAESHGLTVSDLVRHAVRTYLRKSKDKPELERFDLDD